MKFNIIKYKILKMSIFIIALINAFSISYLLFRYLLINAFEIEILQDIAFMFLIICFFGDFYFIMTAPFLFEYFNNIVSLMEAYYLANESGKKRIYPPHSVPKYYKKVKELLINKYNYSREEAHKIIIDYISILKFDFDNDGYPENTARDISDKYEEYKEQIKNG